MHENDLFERLVSDDSEFVEFYPKGYRKGVSKYIFVTGGVMSGVGKGIFSSSLAYLLQCHGYSVTVIKSEGYLNIDSGTLNPFRHGEVFVLNDGTESDLDLGNYERFLNQDLDKNSFITSGRVYSIILSKERSGQYLGRDVLVIPHLTGEIKYLWRQKALQDQHDIVLVELGGTVGDYENLHYIETARQMRMEEGHENVLFCHVSPIIYLEDSNELKTKPTQHGVKSLMQYGIQPDFIICRCPKPLSRRTKEKVSLYCNVPTSNTIEAPNMESIYQLPHFLDREEQLMDKLRSRLQLASIAGQIKEFPLDEYEYKLQQISGDPLNILIAGKYVTNTDSYISINQSLEHAGVEIGRAVEVKYLDVMDLEKAHTKEQVAKIIGKVGPLDGIIVPGGFGKRGIEEKMKVVQYARERKVPFLGICLGFQLALVEIARHVVGLEKANSTEFDRSTPQPIIYLLPQQREVTEMGGTMRLGRHRVKIVPDTKTFELYQSELTHERFRHRYEFNLQYREDLEKHGVVFTGMTEDEKIYQIFEYDDHPYFFGTQFHPEYLSRPLAPRPLFCGLVKAAKDAQTALASSANTTS